MESVVAFIFIVGILGCMLGGGFFRTIGRVLAWVGGIIFGLVYIVSHLAVFGLRTVLSVAIILVIIGALSLLRRVLFGRRRRR